MEAQESNKKREEPIILSSKVKTVFVVLRNDTIHDLKKKTTEEYTTVLRVWDTQEQADNFVKEKKESLKEFLERTKGKVEVNFVTLETVYGDI